MDVELSLGGKHLNPQALRPLSDWGNATA